MKLKIPPAIVAAICAGIMRLVELYLPIGSLKVQVSQWLGGILLLVGAVLGVLGLYQFYREGTSIDPHKPEKTRKLVTDGVYQYSRNPMYLALFILLIAYATLLQNVFNLLVFPLFVWYMNRYQIIPEEEIMEEKFGDKYRAYKSEVQRWF